MSDIPAQFDTQFLIEYCTTHGEKILHRKGIVTDINIPWQRFSRIEFNVNNGKRVEFVATKYLECICVAFETAEVEKISWQVGPFIVSVLQYFGPSYEQVLAQPLDKLSEEELIELEQP